jgi:hypothetical protein
LTPRERPALTWQTVVWGVRKRGAAYAIHYRYRGVIRHEPVSVRSLRAAQACRALRLDEIRAGRCPSPADALELGSLLDDYAADARHALARLPRKSPMGPRARHRLTRILDARRALLAAFGPAVRVEAIRRRLAAEPSHVPGAPILRAAVRWAEWRTSRARGIGSLLFARYSDRLFRAIHPQAHAVWHRGWAKWEKPTSPERIAQANAEVVRRIAGLLATALALEAFDRKFSPRPSAGRLRVARHRARPAGLPTEFRRAADRAIFGRRPSAVATEEHHDAYHVVRPWAGPGRPSSPGREYFADGMRVLAATLAERHPARLRTRRIPWAKLAKAVLARVEHATPLRTMAPTSAGLTILLRNIAARISPSRPTARPL